MNFNPTGKTIFIAALILPLLLFSCGPTEQEQNEELFEKHYQRFEVQLRQDAEVTYPMLDTAYEAYQAGNMEIVAEITTRFLDEYFSVPQVMFAQTVAFLELGKDEQAIDNFEILAMHPFLGSRAKWYQGLVHLRRGEREQARSLFIELRDRTTFEESEWAADILTDLENLDR